MDFVSGLVDVAGDVWSGWTKGQKVEQYEQQIATQQQQIRQLQSQETDWQKYLPLALGGLVVLVLVMNQ